MEQIENEEHLYAPGKIIALYGTLKELPAEGEEAIVNVKSAIIEPSHMFLRYFEVNDCMFYDHLIISYRESLNGAMKSSKESD